MATVGYKIVKHVPLGREGEEGWSRRVELPDGSIVFCVLTRGRQVKVAFKPRNFVGFKWYGYVRDENGQQLWSDECTKSTGAAKMLECAGLLDRNRCGRLTYRTERGAMRALRIDKPLVSYCQTILPRGWTQPWCESCMKTLDYQESRFYNESGLHIDETVKPWTDHRPFVRYHDDATGRWADDGGTSP